MDERTAEIEHVIQHYINRDLFRLAALDFSRRSAPRHHLGGLWLPLSCVDHSGNVKRSVVHDTRESLKRSKRTTVQHLHELLHAEPVLDVHDHVHSGDMIFTFVIDEPEF